MKPILFSTPMVQAILDDRKTQTRRVMKPQPPSNGECLEPPCFDVTYSISKNGDPIRYLDFGFPENETESFCVIPKFQLGDILYARETWRLVSWNWDNAEVVIEFKDGETVCFDIISEEQTQWLIREVEFLIRKEIYVSIDDDTEEMDWSGKPNPWKPSIHLPKYCSRIFLQVTDVRAERLQDISQEDCKAEGVWPAPHRPASEGCTPHENNSIMQDCYKCAFKTLWNSINAKKCPWDSNPWVWVYSFKKIQKP
jgi:hypothetical protein